MGKFPFPRIHGPNYDLCIRFHKRTGFEQAVNNCSIFLKHLKRKLQNVCSLDVAFPFLIFCMALFGSTQKSPTP